ncbi:MAG: hypothetical protein A2046_02445 [Bacteroidetes bacterium GWA2_30_7]|nr:MAG: hypothetical protein A2046_02445 [Bacteroidetes bacterium GWA2_30_7]
MNWKKIITWVSIIGSIASIIGLIYIFSPLKENTLKLDVIVSSCDNLTIFNNIKEPEIKAEFEYKGNKISKLWRLNVVFKNVSEKTIIGDGQLKNILFDKLVFYVKKEYQIIDKKMIKSDFNHTLSILSNDTLLLSFGQWRFAEQLEYSLYVTTELNTTPGIEIFYQPKDRQIIDGDINFVREIQTKEQELITNRLGLPIKKVVYVLFIALSFAYLVVFLIIIVSNIIGYIRRTFWITKTLKKYNDYVSIKYIRNKDILEKYLNKPEVFYDWDDFKGNKYPNSWGLDFAHTKLIKLILTILILSILSFIYVILIFDLIQLFP